MTRFWRWGVAWLVCAILFTLNALPSLETVVDDAFISGRFALNASEGWGWVFNAGEPAIEGYSNLIWTAWLTVGLWLGLDLHLFMVWSGMCCGWLTIAALLVLSILLLDNHPVSVVPPLLLSLDPHFAVVATNGLESAQYMALVFATISLAWCSQGSWRIVLGLAIGCLWASRPEGLVVGGCILIVDLWRKPLAERQTWLPWLAAGAIWGGLLIWRFWIYGAWLPNTAAAKATGDFVDLLQKHWNYLRMDWWFWAGWLLLTIIGSFFGPKNRRTILLWLVITASIAIASQVYLWMPGGRLLLTPMALGFVLLCQPLTKPGRLRQLSLATLFVACVGLAMSPLRQRLIRQDEVHSVVRDNPAMLAARHLAAHAPNQSWLAIRDAGVFAFGVGSEVNVAELHPRALTQLHVHGADANPALYLPQNPAFFVFTTNREKKSKLYYSLERREFKQTTVKYKYLGRVKQHYHRYYDIVVREDIDMPVLPVELVKNRALKLPPNQAP